MAWTFFSVPLCALSGPKDRRLKCYAKILKFIYFIGVFAAWYWTRDKEAMSCPLGSSFCRAFYHTGTIACGSLIIGIIRFIRWLIDYLDKKMKGFDNDVMKCFRKCCMCCLWCLEKFMKFVNRNIYIMTAIKGTNFCQSGKDAFNLLMRNIARVVVLNCVVGFVLFIGKLGNFKILLRRVI